MMSIMKIIMIMTMTTTTTTAHPTEAFPLSEQWNGIGAARNGEPTRWMGNVDITARTNVSLYSDILKSYFT